MHLAKLMFQKRSLSQIFQTMLFYKIYIFLKYYYTYIFLIIIYVTMFTPWNRNALAQIEILCISALAQYLKPSTVPGPKRVH
jgi:hypothetical protein